MHILLLGGTGFIGEYLVKKLSNRKNCKVVIAHNGESPKSSSKRIHYVQLDLTRSGRKLEKVINSADIIVILTQPNRKIIENLISAIKPSGCLKKIVYLSSVLIYGNFKGKQAENFPVNPITDYERGKYGEELMLSELIKDKSLKLCIARLANVYGDVKNRGLINHIFLAILNNGKMTINGKGDSVRDYIFIEDVAAWLDFLIFWNQKNKREIVNICTGKGHSVKEVLKKAEQITKGKTKVTIGAPIQEKKTIIGDNKKITGLSRIKLKYNLIKGLQQTYKNYSK